MRPGRLPGHLDPLLREEGVETGVSQRELKAPVVEAEPSGPAAHRGAAVETRHRRDSAISGSSPATAAGAAPERDRLLGGVVLDEPRRREFRG